MTTSSFGRAKNFADECAHIYLNALWQYRAVARQVADDVDEAKFGPAEWVRTAKQLFDIAALNGVEFAETVLGGPGAQLAPTTVSSAVTLPEGKDVDCIRILSIKTDLHLAGEGSVHVLRRRVRFVPRGEPDDEGNPTGRLSAGQRKFRVVIPTANLKGGTYVGEVTVHPGASGRDTSEDQTVPVQVVW